MSQSIKKSWERPRGPGGQFLAKDPAKPIRKGKSPKQKQAPQMTKPIPQPTIAPAPATPGMAAPSIKIPTENLINEFAFLIDASGSMYNFRTNVVESFNGLLAGLRNAAGVSGQKTVVSFSSFSSDGTGPAGMIGNALRLDTAYFKAPVEAARYLNERDFIPAGGTPLRDAVGTTIRKLRDSEEAKDPNRSFVLYVLTDGQENASRDFSDFSLRTLIEEIQATGRWTVVFVMPPGHSRYAMNWGVPEGNIREWQLTRRGFEQTMVYTAMGLTTHYASRAAGKASTASFFATVADPKEIEKALQDSTHKFKYYQVVEEAEIKPFFEGKGFAYQTGYGYYELVADEKVQPGKRIALMDKISKRIFTGDRARNLVGLPGLSSGDEIKVKPGDHGKYWIFIQSNSNNRKLGRDSRALYQIEA